MIKESMPEDVNMYSFTVRRSKLHKRFHHVRVQKDFIATLRAV